MARYNEILTGRFNRLLQKLLSMKGEVPAPQLSSDIQTVIQLPLGVEARYLESWERFANTTAQAAVAAVNSGGRIRNPGGSNVVAVIEHLSFRTDIQAAVLVTVQHGAVAVDLATTPTSTRLDGRSRTRPTCIVSNGTGVASFGGAIHNDMSSGARANPIIEDENQEITLLPGDALQIITTPVNVPLEVNFRWRERALEESERT